MMSMTPFVLIIVVGVLVMLGAILIGSGLGSRARRCRSCGAPNPDRARYCGRCGEKVGG